MKRLLLFFLIPLMLVTGCPMKAPNAPSVPGGTNPFPVTQPVPIGSGSSTAVPAGSTGIVTTPGGSTAAPAGGTTGGVISTPAGGTAISGGTATTGTIDPTGSPTLVGPEGGATGGGTFPLVWRNLDCRGIDHKTTVAACGDVLRALAANQSVVNSANQVLISALGVELLGSFNNWTPSGASTATLFNDGAFKWTALPTGAQQGTPAIVGTINGSRTVLGWVFYKGTKSANVSAGNSWWSPELVNGQPDFTKVKLWWNNGALTPLSASVGGQTLP